MARRPVKISKGAYPSVTARLSVLVTAPAVYASSTALSLFSWGRGRAAAALQLPVKALVASLELLDSLISDLLAFITEQPAPRAQIGSYQQIISELRQQAKVQQRQMLLLQNELDGVKLEKSKLQIRNIELSDKAKALQLQLSKQAAAAAGTHEDKAAAPQQLQMPHRGCPSDHTTSGVTYDAKSWYLHACVLLAALAVRWWLTNQTDPLQRKVMLVIIWPIGWVYGALVTNCLPHSSTLRAALACCCWALLGYVANEIVSFSVREQQQSVCHSIP